MNQKGTTMSSEQYSDVCKERFDEIINKLTNMDKKLFHDNGNECLQSKINRHEQIFGLVKWLALGVGAILLGLISSGIYKLISHLSKG